MREAFGESPAWSVGVEEELLLLDARTHEPAAAAADVVSEAPGVFKHELFACMLETTTGICADAGEAGRNLVDARRRAEAAAAARGLAIAAAGSHPFALPERQPLTDDPEYREFAKVGGPAVSRQLVCGLHVHVAMPDGETCVRAHERALPWLPVVLAVSANSPWFRGERTGFASVRAEVLATLPRSGTPPPFASYAEWRALIDRWLASGLIRRPTNTWWDARVHPQLGTLELRAPDQPTDPRRAVALVALLSALAVWAAQADPRPASRADYHSNRFHASRFGPRAELVHPDGDRVALATQLYRELTELVGDHLDSGLVAPLDPERSEADEQLEALDARSACAAIVRRSLASPA